MWTWIHVVDLDLASSGSTLHKNHTNQNLQTFSSFLPNLRDSLEKTCLPPSECSKQTLRFCLFQTLGHHGVSPWKNRVNLWVGHSQLEVPNWAWPMVSRPSKIGLIPPGLDPKICGKNWGHLQVDAPKNGSHVKYLYLCNVMMIYFTAPMSIMITTTAFHQHPLSSLFKESCWCLTSVDSAFRMRNKQRCWIALGFSKPYE